jgi:hypothetical protein
MTDLEKLEWAYHTLHEELSFGLPELQALKAREHRVKGVLMDVIESMKTQHLKTGVFVTYETYTEACARAWNDQSRIGFCGSFFERVCRYLGLEKSK